MEQGKVKMISIYAAAVAGVLGAGVSWSALGWPTPATSTDIAQLKVGVEQQIVGLERFAVGTRIITLGQEWGRLTRKIDLLVAKGTLNPNERGYLSDLRIRRAQVTRQLRDLRK